jgi:hypothetical protein
VRTSPNSLGIGANDIEMWSGMMGQFLGIGTDVIDWRVMMQGDMRDDKIFICEVFLSR